MKRLISSTLLAAILILPQLFLPAFAAEPPTSAAEGGSITISTREDLVAFRDAVNSGNSYEGLTITLTADIDLNCSEENYWVPIGDNTNPFEGHFDGNGHVIAVQYFQNYVRTAGLFGYVGSSGSISDLGVDSTGPICSQEFGGVAACNDGTIENCYSKGFILFDDVTQSVYIGGVVGRNGGVVNQCYNTCSISRIPVGTSVFRTATIGGVVASSASGSGGDGTVNCYNTATINTQVGGYAANSWIGGVMGSGSPKNCYNVGMLIGSTSQCGGVVGIGHPSKCFYLEGTAYLGTGNSLPGPAWPTCVSAKDLPNLRLDSAIWEIGEFIQRPVLKANNESGVGTVENPYCIPDLAALETLRDKVNGGNSYEGKHFQLTADIDMSEKYGADIDGAEVSWEPIGNMDNPFNGIFDCGGHAVKGLYINAPTGDEQGLFGHIGKSGAVKNLRVIDGSVLGNTSVGSMVGYNDGEVANCYSTGTVTGSSGVGGLLGHNGGTITNCYNTGSVSGNNDAGGIIGENSGTATNCYYLNTCGAAGVAGTSKTEAEFASGEVAWRLQAGQDSQAKRIWGQNGSYPGLIKEENCQPVYKVTFMNGSDEYAVFYAVNGSTVALPQAPQSDAFEFVGWLQPGEDGGTEFLATAPVTSNITVLAQWKFPRPEISIDYMSEALTGFASDSSYMINGVAVTPTDNTLAATSYIGQTISIVKQDRHTTIADSDAQTLSVPARPKAPLIKVEEILPKKTANEIIITDTFSDCEFSVDGANWQDNGTFSELVAGQTYTVSIRKKATSDAFASESKSRTITTTHEDGATALKPCEIAEISGITFTHDGRQVIITDGDMTTTVRPPNTNQDITINGNHTVYAPINSTVKISNRPNTTLPQGGIVSSDGTILTSKLQISNTTITAPEGKTVAADRTGNISLPTDSIVATLSRITVTITQGTGVVTSRGAVTLPNGGIVTATDRDGNSSEIIVKVGGEIIPRNYTQITPLLNHIMGANGTALVWSCTPAGEISITTDALEPGEKVLAASYDAEGRLVDIALLDKTRPSAALQSSGMTVKLFWLDSSEAPLSPCAIVQDANQGDVLALSN